VGDLYTKRRPTAVFWVCLTTIVFLLGCASVNGHRKTGLKQASQQDWDQSVQSFQRALEADPDSPEIKLLLIKSKQQASLLHMSRGQNLMEDQLYDEAVKQFQMSVVFDPSNGKAGALIEKTRSMRQSENQQMQGDKLSKLQRYGQAREAYKKAAELNPDNAEAKAALVRYKRHEEDPAYFPVPKESKKPISLRFKRTPIINVFEVLTKITGINFIFDKDVKESKVTLFVTDVSFDQFFDMLLRSNTLSAKLVAEKTMLIYPNTPGKIKEYQDLKIRTFYLSHLKAKKAAQLLTKILKSRDITANENLNAIVIRSTKDIIALAAKIIEANDRQPAEVLLNIEILEVSRTKEKQLGIDFTDSVTLGIAETGSSNTLAAYKSLYDVERISSKELLLSMPTATLNLLKQDGDTQLLAKPQLRVKNGEKAQIHIGERVPFRTNRRVESGSGGAVTYDFQYQDIGIRFEASPVINIHSEVTLELNLEISSLGPNVGTTDDPQFSIKTRTAKTTLTLGDGETVIIGGLISDEDRNSSRELPFFGSIPVLGRLFASEDESISKKDILMAVTPLVIRPQEVPSEQFIQFWSGKEKDYSVGVPYESMAEDKHRYLDRPAESTDDNDLRNVD
jgi:general secretion pathway protein D